MRLSAKRKVIAGILICTVLLVVLFAVVFRATLFQEGNPLYLAAGIGRLCLSSQGLSRIPGGQGKYIQRSGTGPKFWQLMETRGWTAVDQLGSSLIIENETEVMFVQSRMWTTHFQVFEVAKIVKKSSDRSYNWEATRDFFPTRSLQ